MLVVCVSAVYVCVCVTTDNTNIFFKPRMRREKVEREKMRRREGFKSYNFSERLRYALGGEVSHRRSPAKFSFFFCARVFLRAFSQT